ncbi:MAG: hypothetical protein LBC10_03995, partial [Deltaproteobacteria bacterium]|nr:hypothetical protein [Deltaproteobacteria bacterium]
MRSSRFIAALATSLCLFLFALCLAGPARAAASPSDALRGSVDRVLVILQHPDYTDTAKRQPLRDEIEQIVTSRGVHSEFRTEQGDPYSELTRIADEVQADAV